MSWNVSMMGRPEKVVTALEEYAAALSGLSKEEYESALPHLVGLVKQNVAPPEQTEYPLLVTVNASGHGTTEDGATVSRSCSVEIRYSYTKVLV
jgi:hypothetical protein